MAHYVTHRACDLAPSSSLNRLPNHLPSRQSSRLSIQSLSHKARIRNKGSARQLSRKVSTSSYHLAQENKEHGSNTYQCTTEAVQTGFDEAPFAGQHRSAGCQHQTPSFVSSRRSVKVNFMITHCIDALQEGITKDIHIHRAPALDTTIDISRFRLCKAQILLLNNKLLITNRKRHNR